MTLSLTCAPFCDVFIFVFLESLWFSLDLPPRNPSNSPRRVLEALCHFSFTLKLSVWKKIGWFWAQASLNPNPKPAPLCLEKSISRNNFWEPMRLRQDLPGARVCRGVVEQARRRSRPTGCARSLTGSALSSRTRSYRLSSPARPPRAETGTRRPSSRTAPRLRRKHKIFTGLCGVVFGNVFWDWLPNLVVFAKFQIYIMVVPNLGPFRCRNRTNLKQQQMQNQVRVEVQKTKQELRAIGGAYSLASSLFFFFTKTVWLKEKHVWNQRHPLYLPLRYQWLNLKTNRGAIYKP